MLISDHAAWIEKASFLSTQAKEPFLHYEHQEFGYNYRMSNVLAAIGVAQMEVLEERVLRRREIFEAYVAALGDIEEVEFMPELEESRGNRWLTTLTLKRSDPIRVIEMLNDANIESRPLWKPMHLQPLFLDAECCVSGYSEKLFQKGLCLPSGSGMSSDDIERVCMVLRRALS